jgi:DNA-binding MarR family transcriptional regulator
MIHDESIKQKINAIKLHPDPMSQAQLIAELLRETPLRNTDLAKELEIKPSYLSHLVRVMKLPDMVIDGYWNKQLTFTHLILISRLKKQEDIIVLYEEILQKGLNVSATERRIREILYLIDSTGKYTSKDRLNAIKSRIESSLDSDARVSIIQTRIKAKIIIEVAGNLVKTSEFIDVFANRFRQKKNKKNIEVPEDGPEMALAGEVVSGAPSDVSVDEVVDRLTLKELHENNPDVTDNSDKKYRFDPDF